MREYDSDRRLGPESEFLVGIIDLTIAAASIGCTAFASEWLIRRREGRRT